MTQSGLCVFASLQNPWTTHLEYVLGADWDLYVMSAVLGVLVVLVLAYRRQRHDHGGI